MTKSGALGCAICGKESCSGQCRSEPPTERPPASANRSKPRPPSETIPDFDDDDDDLDDDLTSEEDSSPDNAAQK